MNKTLAGLVAPLLLAAASTTAAEREVTIDGGKAPLHGALTSAEGAPGPAVLIIGGSGPTDRDGNAAAQGLKPDTQRLLAEGLATRGVASLRFDKRGVGASAAAAPAEADLRFSTYVDDAVAWTRFLNAQPGVTCVVLAGHSEGALIALVAAQKTPVCGVVQLAAPGRSLDRLIVEQLAHAPEPLHGQALAALEQLKAGKTVADPGIPALFRPSVQPYLISELTVDPAREIAKVRAPILILQGARDLQVTVGDANRLATVRPDATLVIRPEMNHVLKDAPGDRMGNIATYSQPALPLDSGVLPAIVTFVRAAKPAA